jgi:hypothetical protein
MQIPTLQVVRLPSGHPIRLISTSYGTEHRCVDGPRWQHLLLPLVGIPRAKAWGWSATGFNYTKPVLLFWIANRDRRRPAWVFTLPQVRNENHTAVPRSGYSYVNDGGSGPNALVIQNFPRRGRYVYLDYLAVSNPHNRFQRVGRFVVSNPTPGPHPQWTPKPLPQAVKVADSTFVLQKFQVGVREPKSLDPFCDEEAGSTALKFSVQEFGKTRKGWRPIAADLTTATGDTLQGGFWNAGDRLPSGLYSPWSVGTEEAAWKIRVYFAQTTGFSPTDTWSFNDIPVPPPSQTETLMNRRVTLGARQIQLRSLRASRDSEKQWEVHLMFQFFQQPADSYVSLIGIENEKGRNLLHFGANPRFVQSPSGASPHGDFSLTVEVPADTRQLSLKLALHRSRIATFLAAPELVKAKSGGAATSR